MAGFYPDALSTTAGATLDTNTCKAPGTAPLTNCLAASTSVVGGQCTQCGTDYWPTALGTVGATMDVNTCS